MVEETDHLTPDLCAALLRGEVPTRALAKTLFEHLLRRCPECLVGWKSYRQSLDNTAPDLETPVRQVIERFAGLRQRARQEEEQAAKLLRELEKLPDLPARVTRVRRSRRFRSWALCERLLAQSQSLSFEHPSESAEVAELAIETAWALDDKSLGQELISDLIARGWASLGHARRLGGQPALAQETFAMCRFFLEQGTGDPLVEAEVAGLVALLRRDQRQLTEAAQLHDRSVAVYNHLGAGQLLARALLQRAVTRVADEKPEAAVADLRRCLELLTDEADPRFRLCAQQTLIQTLHQLGHSEEAHRRFEELASAEWQPTDPWSRLRQHLLKAQLAGGTDQADKAQEALTAARWSLVESGIFHRSTVPPRSLIALLIESRPRASDAAEDGP